MDKTVLQYGGGGGGIRLGAHCQMTVSQLTYTTNVKKLQELYNLKNITANNHEIGNRLNFIYSQNSRIFILKTSFPPSLCLKS